MACHRINEPKEAIGVHTKALTFHLIDEGSTHPTPPWWFTFEADTEVIGGYFDDDEQDTSAFITSGQHFRRWSRRIEGMTKLKVGEAAEFQPGTLKEVRSEGRTFVIANIEGVLYAMDGICGHAGGRLGQGQLIGGIVKCPRHGSEYDLKTGKNVKKPYLPFAKAPDRRTFTISIEGEDVILDI